jgi:monoamine oxidase
MRSLDRRRFLAFGAASLAAPSLAIAQGAGAIDVIVVGAGAAGIAAARRIVEAGRRCVVLEAAPHVGGRCITDAATFGTPYDRGARLLYGPESNPVARLARSAGFEVAPWRPGYRLRVGRRFAREGELESYFAALVRARRAVEDAADGEQDEPASRTLPRDLGDWRRSVEFALGPYRYGKTLDAVSARDVANAADRETAGASRAGCGALLAKLAEDLPVRLSTPVRRVAVWRGAAYAETASGTLQARAVIVTASTNVLASEAIRFDPALPKSHLAALQNLSLGVNERVVLELPGNPLGLAADDLVFERAKDQRTAALIANVAATPLAFVELGGPFCRDLVKAGETALVSFATDWLAGLFGADVKKAVRRASATRWSADPLALGSASAATPGAAGDREVLAQPVRDRIFFAGEALHESLWGTVGGAWQSGERAADAALKLAAPAPRRTR